jgi:replicative DNA helicase
MTDLKLPPQSAEAEQVLLAAIIEQNNLIDELEDTLNENYFYRREHQVIYRRMAAMAMQGQPIDVPLLASSLESADELDMAGGAEYLIDIAVSGRGAGNARHYAKIIRDRWLQRQLIIKGNKIAEIGFDAENVIEAIQECQAEIMDFEQSTTREVRTLKQTLLDVVNRISFLQKHAGQLVGLATGYADLDKHLCGLAKTDLIIVAGRPGMGKTVCAMNWAEHAALHDKNVLVFSLEMSADQLLSRSACSIGRISNTRLRKGQLEDDDWPKLNSVVARLRDKSLTIDDRPMLTSEQAFSRARKVVRQTGRPLDLIVVDYIQLMADKGDELVRITNITRNLKLLAKTMDCPVVALSQLNRDCEKRPNKRPQMSDLRSSGSIEQDADIIMFVYRDEVYHKDSDQKGIAELITAKFRNGEPATTYMAARLDHCRFDNIANYVPPAAPTKKPRGGFDYD